MSIQEKLLDMRQKAAAANSVQTVSLLDEVLAELHRLEVVQNRPELFDIQGKRVMLLNATQASMNWRTHFTLFRNYAMYGPEKIGLIPQGQTVIHEARNILARAALDTDSEWFIMGPDDDLVLPCGSSHIMNHYFNARLPEPCASYNAISRLMSHPADKLVVGALYFVKGNSTFSGNRMVGRAICEQAFRDDEFNRQLHMVKPDAGLIKQDWVAIGFCRIHRTVFEAIIHAADGRWPEIVPTTKGGYYGIFQPSIGPEINEDVSFGKRCKALGIDHWLDSGLVCGHADGTSVFWPHNAL